MGYPPVSTVERIAALVRACPESCPDVTPVCTGADDDADRDEDGNKDDEDAGENEGDEEENPPAPPLPALARNQPLTGSGKFALPALNHKRQLHCNTPPLHWDGPLAAAAQAYADTCPKVLDGHIEGRNVTELLGFVRPPPPLYRRSLSPTRASATLHLHASGTERL